MTQSMDIAQEIERIDRQIAQLTKEKQELQASLAYSDRVKGFCAALGQKLYELGLIEGDVVIAKVSESLGLKLDDDPDQIVSDSTPGPGIPPVAQEEAPLSALTPPSSLLGRARRVINPA